MSSAVDICNDALARVGAKRITSLEDESTEARVCKAVYVSERDAMLDEFDWRFATTRLALNAAVAEPVYEWGYAYTLPSTVIRVLECDDGSADGLLDWQREGNQVLAGIAGPLYCKVIQRMEDPTLYPPTFQGALTLAIAAAVCIPLSENKGLSERLEVSAARAVKIAQNRDGGQGRARVATSNEITSARYS